MIGLLLVWLSLPAAHAQEAPEREDPVDFMPKDTELKLRWAQTGGSYFPWTLVTAFGAWTEIQVVVDRGISHKNGRTWGFGAELGLAQPSLLAWYTSSLLSNDEVATAWAATEVSLLSRTSVHLTEFSALDLYAVGIAGPTLGHLQFQQTDIAVEQTGTTAFTAPGARLGAGVGGNALWQDHWVGGVELRYLVGMRFGQPDELLVEGAPTITEPQPLRSYMRAARGFSWVASIGRRF